MNGAAALPSPPSSPLSLRFNPVARQLPPPEPRIGFVRAPAPPSRGDIAAGWRASAHRAGEEKAERGATTDAFPPSRLAAAAGPGGPEGAAAAHSARESGTAPAEPPPQIPPCPEFAPPACPSALGQLGIGQPRGSAQ
ncbi:Hypothetical predicted protein [Podarcis lilfordi]|uniref:Uncharacterized protein n=1 Tax=Podarcis lilfordi TaxID=74358 RepID=A0AA35JX26_9SAUR|nr:Hypothetical predicted protein [Podarcis lilfordi]